MTAQEHRTIACPGYTAHVGVGLLARLGDIARTAALAHRYVVVTDHTVGERYAAAVVEALGGDIPVLAIPPGEAEKSRARWADLTDQLLALGCGRDSAIVALGGGVVGDLAGFVAATYLRGVPYVQVPTTLLAMVDASVGGKTAVDVPAGKNLVGAFHPPSAVVADVLTLHTLPNPDLRAGLAEVLKHGVVADAGYFDDAVAALPAVIARRGSLDVLVGLVARSVAIKAGVVTQDPTEQGLRKTLNFGHTLGHAVEQLSGYRLRHGEAVAIGMHLEARLAERVGIAESGTAARIAAALELAGLPHALPAEMAPDLVLAGTRSDKKARAGRVAYALPRRVGTMHEADGAWATAVADDDVLAVLRG